MGVPATKEVPKVPATEKVPTVPETLLKKRKANAELRANKIKAALLKKKADKEKRVTIFKKAEAYAKEYAAADAKEIRLSRDARKHGNFYVPSEAKLAIVMRIRGINGLHPRVRKVLQLLRLRQINNATFVKLNKATLSMLRIADPYIAWDIPTSNLSANSFTSADTASFKDADALSPTRSSSKDWENSELFALRISSTKSSPSDPTLKSPTISSGTSS